MRSISLLRSLPLLLACLVPSSAFAQFVTSLSITPESTPLSGSVVLTAASTGGTGAVSYTFSIDGVEFGFPDSAIASRIWYTELMDNGNHMIAVVARDSGGRTAQTQRVVSTTNTPVPEPVVTVPAFPGAQGFGAIASGGRGGRVIYVTNLNATGPGSLNDALGQSGPRYILFRVSGEVACNGDWNEIPYIKYGDVTIAGQTSPGGIIIHGLASDNDWKTNRDNIIIRHLRSRPDNAGLDDALRIMECRNVMLDHLSLGRASDEAVQVPNVSNYSIQDSIFAETIGEHYDRGGMLVQYSDVAHPLDRISVHHNLFTRIGGRMPQIDIDSNRDNTFVFHTRLHLELSSNLYWDVWFPIDYASQQTDGSVNPYDYDLNIVSNYYFVRPTYPFGMMFPVRTGNPRLFFSGNEMNLYPAYTDYFLINCCDTFRQDAPSNPDDPADVGVGTRLTQRQNFPAITYTTALNLPARANANAGAFPRDPMDTRLLYYVQHGIIDPSNMWGAVKNTSTGALSVAVNAGVANTGAGTNPFAQTVTNLKTGARLNLAAGQLVDDAYFAYWATAPTPPTDTDNDGMPDGWEIANGLNPSSTYPAGTAETVKEHNQTGLSIRYTGISGYTNLECYLNRLAEHLVNPSIPLVSPATTATYATWRAANFTGSDLTNDAVSGPNADPDRCGLTNLARYAFALPARGSVANPVALASTTVGIDTFLTLTFPRLTAASDLSYILESSTDLVTWAAVPGHTYTAGAGPITAQDAVAMSTASRRFLRLRTTAAP